MIIINALLHQVCLLPLFKSFYNCKIWCYRVLVCVPGPPAKANDKKIFGGVFRGFLERPGLQSCPKLSKAVQKYSPNYRMGWEEILTEKIEDLRNTFIDFMEGGGTDEECVMVLNEGLGDLGIVSKLGSKSNLINLPSNEEIAAMRGPKKYVAFYNNNRRNRKSRRRRRKTRRN